MKLCTEYLLVPKDNFLRLAVKDIKAQGLTNHCILAFFPVFKVSSKTGCLPCIGPEEAGTYDVSYSIMDNHIDCTVSCSEASKTHKEINPTYLIQGIEDALLDMRTLLEQTPRVKL